METTLKSAIETRPVNDFAAHLSAQLLGCTAELKAVARILDDESLLARPLPQEALISMHRVIGRLRRLGHTTLSLSRTPGPDQPFSLAPLNLAALVAEVVDDFQGRGVKERLQIQNQAANAQVWWSRPEQLKMVLESLITPLLHYASSSSCLTITLEAYHGYLERENGYLLVSITNPGTLLQPAETGQLFTNATPEGSFDRLGDGLNLYGSRQVIEFHGGQLEAEPAAANGGLTLWFTLPLVEYSEERY